MRAIYRADFGALVLRVACPSCREASDVTGPDSALCLWPHLMRNGEQCPDGAAKRSIAGLLESARAASAPKRPAPTPRRRK